MHHVISAPVTAPIQMTAELLGRKWKPAILWHLRDEARRYNELRALLPYVTPKVLTEHLRELEHDGIVARRTVVGGARHVEYSLTSMGTALQPLLDLMHAWGSERMNAVRQPPRSPRTNGTGVLGDSLRTRVAIGGARS